MLPHMNSAMRVACASEAGQHTFLYPCTSTKDRFLTGKHYHVLSLFTCTKTRVQMKPLSQTYAAMAILWTLCKASKFVETNAFKKV